MTDLNIYAYGMLTGLSLVIVLFFLKYWRASHDRLFVFFALSFLLLAATWTSLAAAGREEHYVYLPRLLAFVTMIVGIVDKNRRTNRRPPPPAS